jgi:hypothetical protein
MRRKRMTGVAKITAEIWTVTCSRCKLPFDVLVEPRERMIESFVAKDGEPFPEELIRCVSVECPYCRRMRVDFLGKKADILNKEHLVGKMIRLHALIKEMDELFRR